MHNQHTQRTPISAVVLTKNEAHHIAACLATLNWADELLVVDSFSTDDTVALAQQHGARVVQHPFSNFAHQRNVAQHLARHDWVLFIDADERVSPELRDEILARAAAGTLDTCTAYHIQRLHLYSGRWFPDPARRRITPALHRQIRRRDMARLVNRRVARWERAVHEVVSVPEPRGVLNGVIYHYSTTNLSAAYEAINHYSDLEAALLHRTLKRKRITVAEAVLRGIRTFVYHLFIWQGLRGGVAGFHFAAHVGFLKYLIYAKLGERLRIAQGHGVWTDADRALLHRYEVQE